MKKLYLIFCLILATLTSKSQLMYESFDYAVHATEGLAAQSSGLWQRVNTGDSILVTSGTLSYSGLQASAGNKVSFAGAGTDYYRTFTGQTSGTVYFSFILNTPSLGSLDQTGGYFIGLIQATSTTNFGATIWTRASTTTGKYNIGISTKSNSAVSWLPNELDPGTNYFVVAAYEIIAGTANDVAKMWLNTTAIGGTEPVADIVAAAGTDFSTAGIDKVLLRQDSDNETAPVEIDEIRVGTTWASVTPGGAPTPTLSATSLSAFNDVCINTDEGPNSFTITGSNLMSTDVVVSALNGFTFSTTSGGTYSTTLTLPQGGGAFSQEVFVKFHPTAVQSYSGDIVVAGGGASSINVAASGAGVNTMAMVNSGAATSVTQTSATVHGTIPATGCTAVTAYGIEWSTSAGFTNGTGTAVPASNLSAGSFSSDLSGLASGTTYYYHAYATNVGGTAYGAEQSFTTTSPNPTITTTPLTAFGDICVNNTAGPNSFTINGTNLTTADITVAALSGFTYSTTSGGTYTPTLTLTQAGGTFSQEVFVKFEPTLVQSYNGNISISGAGIAAPVDVAASGAGVNTAPAVVAGSASGITTTSATVPGTISSTGCSAITGYGIEWSTNNGFANGSGTDVPATNLAGGNFSADIIGLTAGTTYYFHAYATNSGGTTYSSQGSFTTTSSGGGGGTVVISQVYPGGGSSSTTVTYKNDYVELHNISSTTQDISGFSLQYGSGTGNFGSSASQIYVIPANTTIAPGKYLLIQLGSTGTGGADLPVTPDLSSTNLSMGAASGKVALVNNSNALGCGATASPCTLPMANIVDLVSYGVANNAEGGASVNNNTALPNNTYGCVRKDNGCTDTDNNNADFDIVSGPVPRNSASPANNCAAPAPSLIATTLTSFGSVCINTDAGPNSFTITGTNLTSTDVVVSALSGYTFSTTSGGTYTATLNIPQPGGAFSQEVFVKFHPTAVQSYNGDIVVSGGGATSINVAATGEGVNTMPTVTSGSATSVTQNSATVAGTIPATGCSAVTAYGIEWSTSAGFANGTGTAVPATNLSAGSFSADLSGLATATTYYYHAYATNDGGTAYGSEQSFTTASLDPTITTTPLTAFGDVCTGTLAGPNSFTINGLNLTTTDINVGPLNGFLFSTTSGGTYTASLILPQPGGTYSQTIYVQFFPQAIQSYNGDIPVNGGGIAAPVNVAVTGAGVNSAPTVTSGAASAITQNSATVAGNISSTGCTAITDYGIEWSTTNGFANGTGTQVPSTNNTGGDFTSALSGLTASTTYYYHAYATNAAGTSYGAQQSFTTAAPPPPTLNATALTGFGQVCVGGSAGPNSFTINGTNLTNAAIIVGPLAGFWFAENPNDVYSNIISITQAGGTLVKTVYVKFNPTAVQSYNGNIPITGGGTTGTLNIVATGSGVNTPPSVTTGGASNISSSSATLAGDITSNQCSNVTAFGIEISGMNGFPNGAGTKYGGIGLTGGAFTATINDLVPGVTYYYKAYATNAGGTAYGAQQSFTAINIPDVFTMYPIPVAPGSELRFSVKNIAPGNYSLLFYNSQGQLALQHNMNVQANYINQSITIPGTFGRGVYQVHLVNVDGTISKKTILVH